MLSHHNHYVWLIHLNVIINKLIQHISNCVHCKLILRGQSVIHIVELKYNHILNYYFPCVVFYCKIYPCCWTLEGNEELVRCLITTNTEAFRCVSDSFTAHMDSLSLSEEVCPLKGRENTAGLSCNSLQKYRNGGISSNLFSCSRPIKTPNCNIREWAKLSVHSHCFPIHFNCQWFQTLILMFTRTRSPSILFQLCTRRWPSTCLLSSYLNTGNTQFSEKT